MKRSDFVKDAPGKLIDIAEGHVAFVPNPLPPRIEWNAALVRELSEADRVLGELGGIGRTLANPHLLIRPFVHKEAVLSSRIEGTRATLSDLLLFDLEPEEEPEIVDAREVSNYVTALENGLQRIKDLPIGTRIIRELHGVLMQGVRGESAAGEFRRLQVHIGPTKRLADATFIPPPANEIDHLMSDLEKFIHGSAGELPVLIRLALIHYQFESIHPFHDGNGRVGRLLVSVLLTAERILDQPLLYLSAYFERHRDQYYQALRRVSTEGAWHGWLTYFLEAVRVQSLDAVRSADRLLKLREEYHGRTHAARSGLLHKLIDQLFISPATTVPRVAKMLDITQRAAQQNVEKLIEAKVLREITGRRRYRIFLADELIRAIEA
ncbi:MAG TPA: Fic family protein [Thermoanaerobaculia bacterium]|nr:Fic family protein [Thermoanaerobaculia bacterium]